MRLRNKYYILRHGEAISNVKNINSSWPEKFRNLLTQKGISQIKEVAKKLKKIKPDFIFSSDLLRAKQTSEIVGKSLKIKLIFDKRLREIGFGSLNGKSAEELLYLSFAKRDHKRKSGKGETYNDVLKRVYNFMVEINRKYKGKKILIVSHQCPLWVLEGKINGISFKKIPKDKRIQKGELREFN